MKLLPFWCLPSSVYTTSLHFMYSHIRWVHASLTTMSLYNLPPVLLAEWPGSFTSYSGGTDTETRVSTKSWPWRRTVSHWALNPQPSSHKSGALTTELSLLSWLCVTDYGGTGGHTVSNRRSIQLFMYGGYHQPVLFPGGLVVPGGCAVQQCEVELLVKYMCRWFIWLCLHQPLKFWTSPVPCQWQLCVEQIFC